jgi:hypothetical protein
MTEDEIADVRATCALPEKKKVANGARSSADKKAKAAVNKAMS